MKPNLLVHKYCALNLLHRTLSFKLGFSFFHFTICAEISSEIRREDADIFIIGGKLKQHNAADEWREVCYSTVVPSSKFTVNRGVSFLNFASLRSRLAKISDEDVQAATKEIDEKRQADIKRKYWEAIEKSAVKWIVESDGRVDRTVGYIDKNGDSHRIIE